MFTQNTRANLRIKINKLEDENINILDNATVIVRLRRRNYELEKEAIIVNQEEQIAICYLSEDDLCMPGSYDYQVIIRKGRTEIKSLMGSFYVNPSIMFKE